MPSSCYTFDKAIRRKMIKEAEPVQFKLRFSNRRYYIKTFIWPDRESMVAGAAVEGPKYHACYVPFSPANDPPCIGELHFYVEFLKSGVVAHELLHAIFDLAWKQRQIINPPSITTPDTAKNHQYCEFLCGELENLTNQFWKHYPLSQ
jgi:hypothetical protein